MKVGLLSDIHGNANALESVLISAKEKKVDKILCCGDYVGYYYDPDKVLALLDKWEWYGISGNHEDFLRKWILKKDRNEINSKYGSGIEFAARKLSSENISKLLTMPSIRKLKIDNYKIILCHGSPWNRDIYIYPDTKSELKEKLFNYDSDFDVLVYGHTHHPIIWEKENKKVVNPGSVGQPRDKIPGASWVLWDTASNNFTFYREEYNINEVIDMCKVNDPDIKYLSEVLIRK